MILKREGLSHSTIRHYHFTLCLVGDVWVAIHPEKENPVRKVRDLSKIFPRQAPTRDINFLTLEELERLFVETKKATNELLHPFIQFLAFTGLRRSEALNLKWKDVDEKDGFIHVRKSKNGTARKVPLEERAKEALRELERRGEYVFSTRVGAKLNEGGFLKPLKKAAARAKINKRVDIHTLRHAYGSNKIRQGWGLKKVSTILGHSDITVTAKVYTHLLDGDLKVRDEYRFDISERKENSNEENKIGGVSLKPEDIMKQIQALQMQLMTAISATGEASKTGVVQNDSETSGAKSISSTRCVKKADLSNTNETRTPETKKGLTVFDQTHFQIPESFQQSKHQKTGEP